MVSKNHRKWVTRLQMKKYRDQEGLFLAEGEKLVRELLEAGCFLIECWLSPPVLSTVHGGLSLTEQLPAFLHSHADRCLAVSEGEMKVVSQMTQPPGLFAIFRQPPVAPVDHQDWVLAVDGLRDPGNLGTLLRSCDWFGVRHLWCSEDTADVYNHKVVQASMGAIGRVNVHYLDLGRALSSAPVPVYGTFLGGKSIYEMELPRTGILLFGNESQGIRPQLAPLIHHRLHIPAFNENRVESLNVAVSAGVVLSELRRSVLSHRP